MSGDFLTLDNPPLSSLTNGDMSHFRAVNCRTALSPELMAIVKGSLSEATQRAYRSDLAHYQKAGGTIPSSADFLAQYLASMSHTSSIATLHRRTAAIAKAHKSLGLHNPTTTELVKATLRGLRRIMGVAQRQAIPLMKDDLLLALEETSERAKDTRDRALLLLGFAGGFRRSELIGLDCEDICRVRQGLVVTIRRSKTDQEGAGRKIGIPIGRGRWCPVKSVEDWLALSGISRGAIFRPVDRHNRVGLQRLSGAAVCSIVRARVEAAGIDPLGYTGHSLRAGFATSAAQAGISTRKIRQQTGHTTDAMLSRYIRDGELFNGNAAGELF